LDSGSGNLRVEGGPGVREQGIKDRQLTVHMSMYCSSAKED